MKTIFVIENSKKSHVIDSIRAQKGYDHGDLLEKNLLLNKSFIEKLMSKREKIVLFKNFFSINEKF